MIKARGTSADGHPLIVLGLSRMNTERLHGGMPIRVSLAELGFPGGQIYIIAGETEEALAESLRPLTSEQTIVQTIVTDRKKGHRPA